MSETREPPRRNATTGEPDARVAAAEAKAQEHLDGWKRARADYENLQKRLEEELAAAREAGTQHLLRQFLPLLDQFETALTTVPDTVRSHPWTDGLQHIREGLRAALATTGVTMIAEAGVPFDPARHEAVGEEASALPTGTVVTILARGYALAGTVLRPAKVKVSKGPTRGEILNARQPSAEDLESRI